MSDTIAAIATGGGVSAVGIIRVSGSDAIIAADRIFRAKNGKKMSEAEPRQLVYGTLLNSDGAVIDLCMCTVSRAPGSYTGEDTAEFHCHGSPVVLSEGLRALFKTGVRQAEPGEFTKRAFLNGRMDLSQAEAVIDLIESETQPAALNAAGQLRGAVGRKIGEICNDLLDMSAHYFAVIDYPDEDIEDFKLESYKNMLNESEKALTALLATYNRGKVMKNGVKTVIIGRPNVGKSSLLNALLGYERAIVTPVAGTTRDTIEEKLHLGNVLLRLIDTAGIRRAEEQAEQLGVQRALKAAGEAELVIAVFDGSQTLKDDDAEVMRIAMTAKNKIAVVNKSDLTLKADTGEIENKLGKAVLLSSLTGDGIGQFVSEIQRIFESGALRPDGEILTNYRQAEAIERSLGSIRAAIAALRSDMTPDAVLTEIETALSSLGEITGKTMRKDIAARIFERFCVGK